MVVRLAELLERIRPAGVPGAAGATGSDWARSADVELAPLVRELESFDRQADAVVDAARRRAESIEADADRRVDAIRARVPEQLAIAAAGAGTSTAAEAELRRIADEADATIDGLRRDHAVRRERVAERAVSIVWAWIDGSIDEAIDGSIDTEVAP